MAGIGDRMNGTGMIVFRDGHPIELPGCPLPDDATLERLRKQNEEWARAVPSPGAGARRATRPTRTTRRSATGAPAPNGHSRDRASSVASRVLREGVPGGRRERRRRQWRQASASSPCASAARSG